MQRNRRITQQSDGRRFRNVVNQHLNHAELHRRFFVSFLIRLIWFLNIWILTRKLLNVETAKNSRLTVFLLTFKLIFLFKSLLTIEFLSTQWTVLTSTESSISTGMKWMQPLRRLCFPTTVNKAQGQSINNVGEYLPQPVSSHWQL